jgi:septal ring factor EnvC (AmiA/AmiB activator)
MTKLVEAFNHMAALYRHLVVASAMFVAVWGVIYTVGKPAAKAYAQEAVLDILEEKGITPEAFSAIQKKVDEIAKEQDQVARDVGEVKTDVDTLKKATDRIASGQEVIKNSLESAEKSREKNEKSLEKIYEILIRPTR